MQNLRLLSFFQTKTTALAYWLWDFQMAPMSSISWRWAFISLYIWGIFASSALWKTSGQSTHHDIWVGTTFPGPGHCGQTSVPIWSAAPWPVFALPQASLLTLEVQFIQDQVFLGTMSRLSWGSNLESYWWHLVGQSDLSNSGFGGDHNGVSTQVPEREWHSRGTWLYLPICGGWYNGDEQTRTPCQLCRHMDLHTMPSDICLAVDVHSSKWMNNNPPCCMDVPLDVVQVDSLRCSWVRGCRGVTLCWIPTPCMFVGQLEQPKHDHAKVGLLSGGSCHS